MNLYLKCFVFGLLMGASFICLQAANVPMTMFLLVMGCLLAIVAVGYGTFEMAAFFNHKLPDSTPAVEDRQLFVLGMTHDELLNLQAQPLGENDKY